MYINEPEDTEEVIDEVEEETPEPTDDIDELKSRLKKFEEKGITQRERTRALKAEIEKLKKASAPKGDDKKTGELDNGDYALLTAKGIEDDDQISFLHKQMLKWDMTLREVLKDEDIKAKLASMQQAKEVAAATPSSTKRGGGQSNDVDIALAKYEQTGRLPEDFKLRAAVVEAKMQKETSNKPRWH